MDLNKMTIEKALDIIKRSNNPNAIDVPGSYKIIEKAKSFIAVYEAAQEQRIKELEELVHSHSERAHKYFKNIKELESKLAMALKALNKISRVSQFDHVKNNSIISSEEYEGAWLDCLDIANKALSSLSETNHIPEGKKMVDATGIVVKPL